MALSRLSNVKVTGLSGARMGPLVCPVLRTWEEGVPCPPLGCELSSVPGSSQFAIPTQGPLESPLTRGLLQLPGSFYHRFRFSSPVSLVGGQTPTSDIEKTFTFAVIRRGHHERPRRRGGAPDSVPCVWAGPSAVGPSSFSPHHVLTAQPGWRKPGAGTDLGVAQKPKTPAPDLHLAADARPLAGTMM